MRNVVPIPLLLMCSFVAGAQINTHDHGQLARHPNDPVGYRFVVHGRDAGAIQNILVIWETGGGPNPDQQGFQTEFEASAGAKEAGAFEVDYRIPAHAGTGRYHIRLRADLRGGGSIFYSPNELGLPDLAVDNPEVFEKPHIKAEEIQPQP